jgi:glycosyl transferase family 25
MMPTKATPTKVFVVSLDTALDRRAAFAARATSSGIKWQFYDAHRELSPGLVYSDAVAIAHKGRPLRPGELGCYSSHYSLWRQLIEDDADQYIILEDDVIVDWKAIEIISNVDLMRSGVDYLRLYQKRPSTFILRKSRYITQERALIELTNMTFGTQGYVITRKAAKTFLEFCSEVRRPIDDQMDRFWDHGVPNLCLFPFPIMEEAVPSMIGNMRFSDPIVRQRTLRWRLTSRKDRVRRALAAARRRRLSESWDVFRYGD